jgi:branched-subunit amino acid ABC-type transport system permease component
MSEIDNIKESLNLIKFWIGLLVAALAGILTWLFNNITTAQEWQIWLSSIFVVILGIIIVRINWKALRKREALKDL